MDAVATSEQEQKRGAPRRRVLMSAQIVYHQDRIAVDCVIRNISETGAQLATETPLELPPSFWLRFHDGVKRPVELVWTKENLLGVRFMDVQLPEQAAQQVKAGAGVKAQLVARIVEIERQLAELRAEISISLRD
jgi:hypothetical protein